MEYEIKPVSKFSLGLKELWQYKELFYMFAWRDIKVKYKQTFLGVLWAIIQPAAMTALFTLSFGRLIDKANNLNMPYPVFALSGFIIWNIFSSGLTNSANSMINNANIIKKIYFPRLIIPVSSILVSLIDFFLAFIVFIPVLIYFEVPFHFSALLYIPLSIMLTCVSTFGFGVFLAAANIKYRDFRYILPFFIQALLFATPVIYPFKITDNYLFNLVIQLNPMTAPIELFRASFMNAPINYDNLYLSCIVSMVLLLSGVYYFRKTENYFADLA